jgi:DNA-binding response OmpR family regulator
LLEDPLVILIAEDDQLIQGFLEEPLSDGGFDSEIASSGDEAIALLADNGSKYRALLTDIDLHGTTTGWEVARHARTVDPAFPIIYMTGAAAEDWAAQGVPNSVLLSKPFAAAQLVTAISTLLNMVPKTP